MEQTKVKNIDINRSKELFAYEMTEILLKLKGEFAAISGKDMQDWQSQIDDEKLKVVPVVMPEVELSPMQVTVPEISACEQIVIPDVQLQSSSVEVPAIPEIHPVQCARIAAASVTAAIPEIPEIRIQEAAPVAVQKPQVVVPPAEAPAAFTALEMPAVHLQTQIPAVETVAAYEAPVLQPVITTAIPAVEAVATYQAPVMQPVHVTTAVPAVDKPTAFCEQAVTIARKKIEVPALKKMDEIQISQVHPVINLDVSAVDPIAVSEIAQVQMQERKLEIPAVPDISAVSVESVRVEPSAVRIPNLEPADMENTVRAIQSVHLDARRAALDAQACIERARELQALMQPIPVQESGKNTYEEKLRELMEMEVSPVSVADMIQGLCRDLADTGLTIQLPVE